MMTQNGSLQKDDNDYPVMGGTSSVDDSTIINSAFDPVTRRLLVDDSGGGGGGFTELSATGTIDGVNNVFTFSEEPDYIVSDHAWYKPTNAGPTASPTVNWTWNAGLSQATLNMNPQEDIFGVKS